MDMKYEVWDKLAKKYNRLWVQKYSLSPTRKSVIEIVEKIYKINNKIKILDVGCGTGQLVYDLHKKIKDISYVGIDVSKNMIQEAKSNNVNDENVEFKNVAIEDYNADDKYDIIICTHSFPYFPDKKNILKKLYNLSNENANIIIVNSSTNTLKDLIINFFLKATTSKAKYLSIEEMKKMYNGVGYNMVDIKIIREKFYMPTIALFYGKK